MLEEVLNGKIRAMGNMGRAASPEERLLIAIVVEAMESLDDKDYVERSRATTFLFSDDCNEEAFQFGWICNHFDINIRKAREAILISRRSKTKRMDI